MSDNERKWNKVATLVVCIFLVVQAFLLGLHVGKAPSSNIRKAMDSLHDLLNTLYSTDMYGGDVPFEDVVDAVTDDVYDALAWLEKEP